eukprot:2801900-Pleurochrysis_carterae.AAC.4
MFAVSKACKVTHNQRPQRHIKSAAFVLNDGLLGAAQAKKSVEEGQVVVLEQPLGAVLVVVNHSQAEDAKILSRLRRVGVVQNDRSELELAKASSVPGDDDGHRRAGRRELAQAGHRALLARVVGEQVANNVL